MIESEQALLADILAELKAIKKTQIKRDDIRQMVLLSDVAPYMLDYRDRYYVYCWSAIALTLTAEDIGNITIPANTWVNLNFPPGLRLFASKQVTTVPLYILQTDSSLSSASIGSVVQGTNPWVTTISNVNANGLAIMANSSPVVIASDQSPIPVGPTAGVAFDTGSGAVGAYTLRTVEGSAGTGTQSSVAGANTDTTILAANTSRRGAVIYNDSTQTLYLLLASGSSSTSNYSVQVPSQGYFELPGPTIYNGIIKGIWPAANGNARVTEFS